MFTVITVIRAPQKNNKAEVGAYRLGLTYIGTL